MSSENKVALVTGAAKRLGKNIALALAEKGYDLGVHFHQSRREAEEVVREIEEKGQRALLLQADIAQEKEVEAMGAKILEHWGRLDVLVHSAAIFFRTPFESLNGNIWDQFMSTNLKGAFLCAYRMGKIMKKQGGGKIIHLTDVAALRPWVDYLPYSVSKAGVLALTQALAKALAPTVQVNALVLGPILFQEHTPPEEKEREVARTLLKRMGTPADVARAVVFLAESDFITGASLSIDGGRALS